LKVTSGEPSHAFVITFVLLYVFKQDASGCVTPKIYEQLKLVKDTDKRMSILMLQYKNTS